jgi:YidC/Oxa1 family membrane protein insertase
VIEQLAGKGYKIIIRPHPEYTKRFPGRIKSIVDRHSDLINDDFSFELDFMSNETIYQSDLVITDWSNIAFEFSFCTKLPTISINTAMKVMNPEYKRIGIEPINITLRDVMGVSVDPDRLGELHSIVEAVLADKDKYRDRISAVMSDYVYYPGRSGEAGGKYIISRLGMRQTREYSTS